MIRVPPRFAALVAAAVASAALIGGAAQAVEGPVNVGGAPGTGTAAGECRSAMPPQGDLTSSLCVARVMPGEPGPAVY